MAGSVTNTSASASTTHAARVPTPWNAVETFSDPGICRASNSRGSRPSRIRAPSGSALAGSGSSDAASAGGPLRFSSTIRRKFGGCGASDEVRRWTNTSTSSIPA